MMIVDERQKVFSNFKVPDPIRIKKVESFVRKYYGNLREIYILECGICDGGLADILSNEANCYGVDTNPRNLPGIKVYKADLNASFPEFNKCFDTIFAGELMEHIFDDMKFIRRCNMLLKPGGLFIVTVPNLNFLINRFLVLFGKMPMFAYAPYHYHIYNKKALQDLLEKEGFKILKFSSSHVLFSTRRNKLGRLFEKLGDIFPSFGAHLIVYSKKDCKKE